MEQTLQPKSFQEQRLRQLFDECQNSVIGQIIGPFGLSMSMFNDKDGGGVDTIRNVRNGVYASKAEQKRYDERGAYDPSEYHSHSGYRKKNAEVSQDKKNGELTDAYSGKKVAANAKIDLDHANSAKGIHDDAGRILAEKNGADLANQSSNLYATNSTINRSKGQKPMEEFITDWEKSRDKRLSDIASLSKRNDLSEKEQKKLAKLQALEEFSPEEARAIAKKAKKQYEKQVNQYYRSGKFIKSAAKDAGKMAVKTAIQQAIGSILVEFAQASFHEMKMFIRERAEAMENIFEDIKNRLKRIMQRVLDKLSRWKEIAADLRDGLLSGFLSSLTTTLVNIFATTAKRFVRAIREGIRSLVQAFKVLFFRPEEMTEEEAIKIVIKSLTGVFITTISIAAESGLNTFLQSVPVIGQFASIITPVLLGILSGISIAIVSYYVDKVFHLFALTETQFRQLCVVGDLQLEYSSQLNNTADNIIQMGNSYQQIIEANEEISEHNKNTFQSQNESIALQNSTMHNITSTTNSYGEVTSQMASIDRSHLKHELNETSDWLKNRKKRQK